MNAFGHDWTQCDPDEFVWYCARCDTWMAARGDETLDDCEKKLSKTDGSCDEIRVRGIMES